VRLQRLVQKSAASNAYFLSTKSGIRHRSGAASTKAHPGIPVPPFAVPCILEALRTSEQYGHLTHLVPEEADYSCAEHVSRKGGALLTSDSDLLLYDLGQDGSVVFLDDVEIRPEDFDLPLVQTYRQRAICKRLSIEPGQRGILSLAFEIKRNPYKTIAYWTAQSKKNRSAYENPVEYADFISEYVRGSNSSRTMPDSSRFLDPRVSEFLLTRTALGNTDMASASTEESPNPAGSVFYLPLLLDRWDHESAWRPSTWIRQLAYSLCPKTPSVSSMVTEYGRTMSLKSNGKAIELLSEDEMTETANRLLNACGKLTNTKAGSPHLQWAMFCLTQEITHSSEQGKQSLVKEVLQSAIKSRLRLDPGRWSTVHLLAQIQGTLYSLRILHQMLSCQGGPFVGAATKQLPVAEMLNCLSALPAVKDYPGFTDTAALFSRLQEAGDLDGLLDTAGLPHYASSRRPTASPMRPRRAGRQAETRTRVGERVSPRSRVTLSGNPFGAFDTSL
jgi:hypothetical protein